MKVYLDNKFVDYTKAKVSLSDYGYQYGYGLFETFRTYNGKVFLFREHYKRLTNSAKKLKLRILSYTQLKNIIQKVLSKNTLKNTVIRLTISKKSKGKITLSIVPRKLETDKKIYSLGVKCTTKKIHVCNFENSKTLSFLQYLLAREEKGRFFDVILLNNDNYVCEGSISNVFIFKNNNLITPSLSLGIVKGITRDFIKKLARNLRINTLEKKFTLKEIFNADECFLTNSTKGIIPVIQINGKKIGNAKIGEITHALSNAYKEELKKVKNFR